MYNPYGFHSMRQQYREEAMRDARTRHLEERLQANRTPRPGWASLLLAKLALVGAASPTTAGRARTW